MSESKPTRRRRKPAKAQEETAQEQAPDSQPETAEASAEPDPPGRITEQEQAAKPLKRPWPTDYYADIRKKAAKRRQDKGGPKPIDPAERGPAGQVGVIGGDVVCANLDCDRRMLIDGMVVWVFKKDYQNSRRSFSNGDPLCLDCAAGLHKGTAMRVDNHMKQLVERYGAKESKRITQGMVLRGGTGGRVRALSRMSG